MFTHNFKGRSQVGHRAKCWVKFMAAGALFLLSALAFAASPTAVLTNGTPADPLVGDSYCFTSTLKNTGDTAYGPYLRLSLPAGISFTSASYLTSLAVTATNVGIIPVTDPLANQAVSTPVGSRLYLLKPPIGSMVGGAFELPISICTTVDNTAVTGVALPVTVQGVYQQGDTPTGANGPFVGAVTSFNVTPKLVTLKKGNNAPESERPPGSAWPITYTATADIADGKTLTGLSIADPMPAGLIYNGSPTVTGGVGCSITAPAVGTSGGVISATCTSATGTTAANELVLSYSAYIGSTVLNTAACSNVPLTNTATLNASFNSTPIIPVVSSSTVTASHVVVQKSVSAATVKPADTLTYTLNIQTSQSSATTALVVADVLPDGLTFGSTLSVTVNGTNVGVTPTVTGPLAGITGLSWDIGPVSAAASVVLSYTATVNNAYTATSQPVYAGDQLTNNVKSTALLVGGTAGCENPSASTVTVVIPTIKKTLLNPQASYKPGDSLTYRLQMNVDAGKSTNIVFKDYFPLPVFDVTTINTTFPGGDIGLAAVHTFDPGVVPSGISINAAENALIINWPSVDVPAGTGTNILAVDVTVKVTNKPFVDNLSLTNLMEGSSSSTANSIARASEGVLFKVNAPVLTLKKGVLSSNGAGTISPLPGVLPVDGNLSGADAGDVVTFRLTVENTGGAPAYQVNIKDTPPAGLSGCTLGTVTDGSGTALANTGNIFGAGGLTLTNPLAANDANPLGGGAPFTTDTALINLSCTVDASTGFAQVLSNSASVVWAAASDSTVFYPAVSDAATVTTSAPAVSKTLVASSEPSTTGTNLAIGEVVRYRLVARVPEGGPRVYALTDVLPAGLQYLNDGTARFAFISNGGAGITSTAVACANTSGTTSAIASSALTCVPVTTNTGAHADGEDPVFTFGNITNSDSDADDEFIVLELNALVLNTGSNNPGKVLGNRASLSAAGNPYNSAVLNVTVVEPNITLAKSVSPTVADAGDAVTYTVTYTNSNAATSATAYDVVLTDFVPTAPVTVGAPTVTFSGGVLGVTDNSAGNTIAVTVDSIPPGGSVTVTYQGVLTNAVTAGQKITNTANLAYSSLPGPNGSGAGITGSATPGVPGAVNGERQYVRSASKDLTVAGVTLVKTIVATSSAATTSNRLGNGLVDLAIGEQVTFRITATLPEGDISQLKITDTLPASAAGVLQYVSANVVSVGSSVTNLTTPNPTAVVTDASLADGVLDTVSFDFGSAKTSVSATVSTKQVTVEVVAVVVNRPAVNIDSRQLTNIASVQFGTGLNATASAMMDLVEPSLSIVKSTTASTVQAGQVIPFTITVSHFSASHADAFDVSFADLLPPGFTYVTGSLVYASGLAPTSLSTTGNNLAALWASFPQGSSAVLTFNATVDGSVTPGQLITNKADLAWTSMPGVNADERAYTGNSSTAVTVSEPGLSKSVFSTSDVSTGTAIRGPGNDLTIGEHVTYRIVANFIEGTTPNAVLRDQLPKTTSVFRVVSSRIVSIGTSLSGATLPGVGAAGAASDTNGDTVNDLVTWNLGTVVNNPDGISDAQDQIVFEVEAVVLDDALNQGVLENQTNQARLTYGSTGERLATAVVDVVEPLVSIVKTLISPSSALADASDALTYRVTLSHRANSSADAFNVEVTDTLPAVVAWASTLGSSTCPGIVTDASAPHVVKFTVSAFALGTSSCTIDYIANVDLGAVVGATYANSAALQYDSQPVYLAGETRQYTPGPAKSEFTIFEPLLVKAAVSTSLAETGSSFHRTGNFDLAIGELVDYDITVVVPEADTPDSVITDLLPASAADGFLEVVGASVLSIGSNISTTLPGTAVLSDTTVVDGKKDKVVFAFGKISNKADNLNNADDTIVVRVTARVVDLPDNVNTKLLTNNASFTYGSGSPLNSSADVDVVEPVLAVTKSMTLAGGGFVDIAMTLTNSGTSPAYNASVDDVLKYTDWDLSNIAAVTVPAGFVFANTAGPGTSRTVKFSSDPLATAPAGVVLPGGSATFVFRAKLATATTPTTPVLNTAKLTAANSAPVAGGRPVTTPDANAQLDLPTLVARKTVAVFVDADGSGGASPGDTLRYTITLQNGGTSVLTNVSVTDTPDANTNLLVGSVTPGGSAATVSRGNAAGQTDVLVNFASISNGATATVTFDVTIPAILPVGVTQLSNQATVTSNELTPVLTDDPIVGGTQDPTVTPVNAAADLGVIKTGPTTALVAGGLVPYTIEVRNLGPNTAVAVQLTDVLPSYLTFVSADAPCSAGFPCSLGNLAAGGSITINLSTRLSSDFVGPSVSNTANVTSLTPDPVPLNNQGVASSLTSVQITIAKRLDTESGSLAGQVEPGERLSYSLTLTNTGGSSITSYALTDALTPAAAIASVTASNGGVYDAAAGTVTWTNLTVLPQVGATPGVLTLTVEVTAKSPLPAGLTQLKNVAYATGSPPPECPGPACVSISVLQVVATSIPTLSEWGRLLLISLLTLLVIRQYRVGRHKPSLHRSR